MFEDTVACCQIVKDKDFESNSQHPFTHPYILRSCCQIVKDKDFESNSQQTVSVQNIKGPVVRLSKIKISKAIHNKQRFLNWSNRLLSDCQR